MAQPPTEDERRAGVLSDEMHKARRKSRVVRFAQIEEGEYGLGPGEAPKTAQVEALRPEPTRQQEKPQFRCKPSRRKTGRRQAMEPAALVRPVALGAAREQLNYPSGPPELGGPGFGKWQEGRS